MPNKIEIFPPYEKEKVSIISVLERIDKKARFVRQSGPPGRFASIDIVIEPYEGSIIFENEARIQEDLKGDNEWELGFPMIVCAIFDALKSYIQNSYDEHNLAIGNFKFKLINIDIHKYDSKLMDYKIATLMGLKDVFKV